MPRNKLAGRASDFSEEAKRYIDEKYWGQCSRCGDGIQWLGQLVYPERYMKDIKEEVKSFYKLFYHIDVTQEQLAEILKDSIPDLKK